MTTSELQKLEELLPSETIRRLADACPSLRIPLKKILTRTKRDEFFRLHTGGNTRSLAGELGISLSTAYNWLAEERRPGKLRARS